MNQSTTDQDNTFATLFSNPPQPKKKAAAKPEDMTEDEKIARDAIDNLEVA